MTFNLFRPYRYYVRNISKFEKKEGKLKSNSSEKTQNIDFDESSNSVNETPNTISLSRMLSDIDISNEFGDVESEFSVPIPEMRQGALGSISEINEELDNLYAPISDQAQEQIHAGIKYNIKHFKVVDIFLINNNNNVLDECILVYGHSMMVELFLKAASRKRKFQVIVCESATGLSGLKLATNLSRLSSNISVTMIPDSNIYAIMSRVNKVRTTIDYHIEFLHSRYVDLIYVI